MKSRQYERIANKHVEAFTELSNNKVKTYHITVSE